MTDQPPQPASGTPQPSRRQLLILAAILIAYAGLSHYSTEEPQARGLGAALSLGPILLVGLFLVWRWLSRVMAALATLATVAALVLW